LALEDSSEKCNRKKSKEFRNIVDFPELTQTTTMNLRSSVEQMSLNFALTPQKQLQRDR